MEEAAQHHHSVTIRRFLTEPEYLGGGRYWPAIIAEAERIVERDPVEVVLAWATGSGKSALGGALCAWWAYKLLPDIASGAFFERHGLKGDKPVFMFQLATRAEQARDNVFAETYKPIQDSPWFMEHYPPADYKHEIRFTDGGKRELPLVIRPMGSSPRGPLAYDCFACIVDEAGWWVDSEGKLGDSAEEISNRIRSRMVSRFLSAGKLLNLSAPRYDGDFSQRRAAQIERGDDPQAYSSRRAIWDMKPELAAELERGDCFEAKHPSTGQVVLVPNSLRRVFAMDELLAWRDFGAVPTGALEPFDGAAAQLLAECPRDAAPQSQPGLSYYAHGDIGLTHDACALALAHAEQVGELLTAVVDRIEVIAPRPDTGVVEIEDVKELILHWRDQGYRITCATFDQFQSADLMQRLSRDGVPTEPLSVDGIRGIEHYNRLRIALHEKRVAFSAACRHVDTFEREYKALELVRGDRVDHSPGQSKDVADAVCGAVSQALAAGPRVPISQRFKII